MKTKIKIINIGNDNYVEVKSLITWSREAKEHYFPDEGSYNRLVSQFIDVIEGTIVEMGDESDLEWQ